MGNEIQPLLWLGKEPGIREASGLLQDYYSLSFPFVADLRLFWASERASCEDERGGQGPEELPGCLHLSRDSIGHPKAS